MTVIMTVIMTVRMTMRMTVLVTVRMTDSDGGLLIYSQISESDSLVDLVVDPNSTCKR
jgi:hypothetical protein